MSYFRNIENVDLIIDNKNVDFAIKTFQEIEVKKNTGRTAKEHIQNRLASEAKRLSFFTQLSAKEIGFKLGFNDPSHFAKFSKKFVSKGNS